jgi:hypothetical protein
MANAVKTVLKTLGISVGIVLMVLFMTPATNNEAMAAGSDSQQANGKMMKGGQGGHGGQATGSKSGAKGVKDAVLAEDGDDDSDRPAWAGGNPTENPHSGGGEGKPDGAGTMKGEDYGDLIVLLRDPVTGIPEETPEGEFLVCLDAACTETVPTVDGEIPAGVTPVEVEFGRAAVARSPDKVTEKALTDALTKLTADGVVLGTDTSGRISYTVDGVTSTIDSPLENLALYIALVTGDEETVLALGDLATMNTAASLLAAVADKTGDISLDYVVYNNVITGVVPSGDFYDYSTFTYTRDFPTDYTYFYMDGEDLKSATLDINAYLADVSVNGLLTSDGGATLFSAAADDAVEVIELVHTQIHDSVLPGTVPIAVTGIAGSE